MIPTLNSQLWFSIPKQIVFDTPNKHTIIRLRWLVVIVCSYMLILSQETLLGSTVVHGFVLIYLLTNATLYFLDERFFKSLRLFSLLVIVDTLVLSFSLVVADQLGSDLYLTYFLIIMIAGFWRDFRWSLGFAILLSLLYSGLLLLAENLNTYMVLRIPFLFVASLLYGYFTQVVSNERTLREKAEKEARRDFLTGLPNRQAYDERIQEELERAIRYKRLLSILMIDLDDFKTINDSLGHEFGDMVLQKFSEHLNQTIRRSDFAARLGGDEFVVILPETDLDAAVDLANRIRSRITGNPIEITNGFLPVTISIGISSNLIENYSDHSRMKLAADRALYRAKRAGKNKVETPANSNPEQLFS
jgi:diguanylate cyclase (GGDEF)-like protein